MRITVTTMLTVLLLFSLPIHGQAAVHISANNAVLMEEMTGRVLFEKNAYDIKPVASITKIMTAIIAIEHGTLTDTVKVSEQAVLAEGSSIYLAAGDKITLKDLLYGLMLRSGNDAAIAIAEHVGGSVEGFVYLMNKKASEIGMIKTNFTNPHGLHEDEHYSTAYDIALLTRYAMQDEIFQEISKTPFYKSDNLTYGWKNKHRLVNGMYEHSTGGKTGFTRKSGRTLMTSASKDNLDLIVVTLNGPDDWNDHINLFNWGFEQFQLEKLLEKGKVTYPLKDVEDFIYGYVHEDVLYPLNKEELNKLKKHSYILQDKKTENSVIGKTVITLDGEPIKNISIYNHDYKEKISLRHVYNNMLKISGFDRDG